MPPIPTPTEQKLEFAQNLIRSPFLKKLGDRTFQGLLATAFTALIGCISIWNTKGVPVTDKINSTGVAFVTVSTVIAAWNASEKSKDAKVAQAALSATINPLTYEFNAEGIAQPITQSLTQPLAQVAQVVDTRTQAIEDLKTQLEDMKNQLLLSPSSSPQRNYSEPAIEQDELYIDNRTWSTSTPEEEDHAAFLQELAVKEQEAVNANL